MRVRFGILATLLLLSSPAFAGNSALEDARRLTKEATVEYNVGRFDQALDLYTKAYERYPKPALLFNLGQCQRQLGNYERAAFFYQGYLRGLPKASNRALVEKLLEESERQIEARRSAEEAGAQSRTAPDAEARQRAAEESEARPRAAEEAQARSHAADEPPATPSSVASGEPPVVVSPVAPPSLLRIAGLGTAGVGVLLIGGAVYEGLHAASLSKQISDLSAQQGTWTSQAQSKYDSGQSSATVASVLWATGVAALAGGVVLTWLGWPRSTRATGSVAPLPGGASVDLVARF